ncbi:dihydrolipoyl dehydrogenase [Allofrancisella guangzhouensis]|uniref:Dihydrolipoyl dehydrogenase n=1 Tax=Allofrancisella guangzhouensis TaxID=594679 RepID=A0A0A8E400_9GAMM|nr:dihydrolipoyl dehydrogenase [Allofrancisella guangzhouensis]AJC48723.1 dihydrolipoamide dehydrogenase [Allofrancisella guangzhouensis]MBK2027398.1 dihydrolipoyl dehydrogenase [Allofrancisella guangzhouensis]MBK2044278.1 dihydrolipoyl dehydrogenase [Allofrancisella guangzhouensis]MBK2045186.1 dihydrolipoyl dehydrogenase [Allofrancisella guangzhouensis]
MSDIKTQVVVLGSGPGGYSAAFRAADLGLEVTLIERYENIGGVCLNVGCIPSKALLHIVKVINEARHLAADGILEMGDIKINKDKILKYKNDVVSKLTSGLKGMAQMRKVKIVQGYGKFVSDKELAVESADGKVTKITFDNCIIAAGSSVINLPFVPKDDRIIDSTGALEMKEIPETMLVVGGGIIGLEMAQVYSELGTKITVVEFADQLMNGVDKDIVKAYEKMNKRYEVRLKTGVTAMDARKDGIYVTMEGQHSAKEERYDRVLMAIGRKPNGKLIDAEKAGVRVDEKGFIPVDKQLRTNVSHIFAIGDIIGQPMLAHKAVPEGRTAAEVISGLNHSFDPLVIPAVAYTDPEVAWVGETETSAKAKGIKYEKGVFPWAASGRSLSIGRSEGMTKVLFDENHRIIGASIVGTNAGELISEAALAIEMGCDAEDIALTVHPHPTLSESLMMATEVFEGTATDLPPQKKS